jgi:hypothetical protein
VLGRSERQRRHGGCGGRRVVELDVGPPRRGPVDEVTHRRAEVARGQVGLDVGVGCSSDVPCRGRGRGRRRGRSGGCPGPQRGRSIRVVRRDQRADPEAESHDEGDDQPGEPGPPERPDDTHVGARAAHRVDSVAPRLAPVRRPWWTGTMVEERNTGTSMVSAPSCPHPWARWPRLAVARGCVQKWSQRAIASGDKTRLLRTPRTRPVADTEIDYGDIMADPHLSAGEFRRHGHEVVDWIADYWAASASGRCSSRRARGDRSQDADQRSRDRRAVRCVLQDLSDGVWHEVFQRPTCDDEVLVGLVSGAGRVVVRKRSGWSTSLRPVYASLSDAPHAGMQSYS